jgi:hypothetical protein
MSALGKLLAVFVFLGALVWLGFTAALFSTRSNWKAVADDAKVKLKEAEDRANALTDQVREERKNNDARLAASEASVAAIRTERDSARDEYAKLKASTDMLAAQTQKLQPTLDEYQSANATLQSQADKLTAAVTTTSQSRDQAKLEEQKAKNAANDAKLELNVTLKALDDQIERTRTLLEASRGGGGEADAAFRGDVIAVGEGRNQDIIVFSGGANAGVKVGKRYVVTRSVAPFYVGTVSVIDASQPGQSSGVFTPAAGQKLAGDYIPKKGDSVSSN